MSDYEYFWIVQAYLDCRDGKDTSGMGECLDKWAAKYIRGGPYEKIWDDRHKDHPKRLGLVAIWKWVVFIVRWTWPIIILAFVARYEVLSALVLSCVFIPMQVLLMLWGIIKLTTVLMIGLACMLDLEIAKGNEGNGAE